MLRASAACEAAGFPSSSLVCEGFMRQAGATSVGLGMPNIPLALVPGHIGTQSNAEIARNIAEVTAERVIENLTSAAAAQGDPAEPGARDIVFRGGFQAVNRYFVENEWSDGLPVVPPTEEAVAAFLAHTARKPDEMLGVLLPDNRAATVWSVAVNGVMAGCRPEHMPILVALIEAMCDPRYGNEHSGNTPGGDTLIILNGPIVKELGFNYQQGVLRDGFLPNTTVGRFWRLYLRNVAGFLPHRTDKATFGNTWRVVLAENEDVLAEIGWEPTSVEMGHAAGEDTVTVARYTGGGSLSSVTGSKPEELLPYLADSVQRFNNWQITFTTSHGNGTLRPLVVLTPILARTLARAGWSKLDVKRYLYEHARRPAWEFERQLRDWNIRGVWNLTEDAQAGLIPPVFHASDDPNRMVPIVWKPEDYMITVSGDELRNNAYVFAHNGFLGYPVGQKIRRKDCEVAGLAAMPSSRCGAHHLAVARRVACWSVLRAEGSARRTRHSKCAARIMTTKPTTYIVCDHCGSAQATTGEQSQGADAGGRSHRALDLPCSNCGRPGGTSSGTDGGTETMRRIVERENDIAG